MNKPLKYLIYLLLASFILGPLGAIPSGIPQVNVYFTDIIIGLICLIWMTKVKQSLKLIKTDSIAIYFCIFVGISLLSLIFSPIHMNPGEKLISGLYIVRLFAYFFVYLTVRHLTNSSTLLQVPQPERRPYGLLSGVLTASRSLTLLTITGLILAVIGWLQYFLYPDLRNIYYLGWDPHFKRIFSSFLDPNYFGLMMVLTLILLFELVENDYLKTSRLSASRRIARRIKSWVLPLLTFLTLMFTYSRSSYLALIVAISYYAVLKKRLIILTGGLIILIISAFLLPRPSGESVKLERIFSVETRIESWQQSAKIFLEYPILGVGFNTIRYAKKQFGIEQENLLTSHAGAGFENSFLFVAATTGLLGLVTYLLFLRQSFKNGNTIVKVSLVAIITHSLFLNSLFLPWIMIWMWSLLAVNSRHFEDGRDPSPD